MLEETEFVKCLYEALIVLNELAANPQTDFYKDFVQGSPDFRANVRLEKARQILKESKGLSYEVLTMIADTLGFKRLYTVIELSEKYQESFVTWANELSATLGKKVKLTSWGLRLTCWMTY
jgi:hypothetical protein